MSGLSCFAVSSLQSVRTPRLAMGRDQQFQAKKPLSLARYQKSDRHSDFPYIFRAWIAAGPPHPRARRGSLVIPLNFGEGLLSGTIWDALNVHPYHLHSLPPSLSPSLGHYGVPTSMDPPPFWPMTGAQRALPLCQLIVTVLIPS